MTPDWHHHFLRQTDYQIWANQVLFDSLARLHPDTLQAHEGLFYGSIQHTVDHLLMVLRLWAGRLRGEHPVIDLGVLHHTDWVALKHQLQLELREFRHWLEAQPPERFAQRAAYARMNGDPQENAVTDVLTHLMTHFVHHRGQISAVATRLGAPVPEMDFIYFVRAMERAAREIQASQQQQQ
jgi:uncharacterized damage-inducible protein DinB